MPWEYPNQNSPSTLQNCKQGNNNGSLRVAISVEQLAISNRALEKHDTGADFLTSLPSQGLCQGSEKRCCLRIRENLSQSIRINAFRNTHLPVLINNMTVHIRNHVNLGMARSLGNIQQPWGPVWRRPGL